MEDVNVAGQSGDEVVSQSETPDNTPAQNETSETDASERVADDDNQPLHDGQTVEPQNDNPEITSSVSLGDEQNAAQGGEATQQEEQNLNGGNHGGSVSFRGSCDDKCIKCNVSSSKAFWS